MPHTPLEDAPIRQIKSVHSKTLTLCHPRLLAASTAYNHAHNVCFGGVNTPFSSNGAPVTHLERACCSLLNHAVSIAPRRAV